MYNIKSILIIMSLILLSSCYKITDVYTSNKPYKTSKTKFEGYSYIKFNVVKKPRCDNPTVKITLSATANYSYQAYYQKYVQRKETKFHKTYAQTLLYLGAGAFGLGTLGAINSESSKEARKNSIYIMSGGALFLGGGIWAYVKAKKKTGEKIPRGYEIENIKYDRELRLTNMDFKVKINGKQATYKTDDWGRLTINMKDFGYSTNHDYNQNPVTYELASRNNLIEGKGQIKVNIDRGKIVSCLYDNIIDVYMKDEPESQRELVKIGIQELLNADNCYSKAELGAALVLEMAKYLEDKDKKALESEIISILACYIF